MLLRKLLKTPISTPKPSLYLDTGCVPLRYVLKGKRIMFLHHILTREETALISRVFWAQVQDTAKGDWCQVVREDLDMIGLDTLSFNDIAKTSKEALKALVQNRIKVTAFKELLEEKNGLSKISGLSYTDLELQPYLVDHNLPTRLKQQLFRWRTRMIKVGYNYGSKVACPICSSSEDTQTHLLECIGLGNNGTSNDHSDSDTYNILSHMKRLEAAIRRRESIISEREKLGDDGQKTTDQTS